MIRTTREIIKNAKFLAGATNSNFTDFYINTVLLNGVYRDIYTKIITHSAEFVETLETQANEVELPSDCFEILSVEYKGGGSIERSSIRSRIESCYYIENNCIYLPNSGTKVIKYSKLPVTITAPDKSVAFTGTLPELHTNFKIDDEGNITESSNSSKYLGKEFVFDYTAQKATMDDEDVTDYFARDGLSIVNIVYDSPYMAISYSDGSIYIFNGFNGTEYNYNCIFGHETKGVVYAITTDDTTGKGIIWVDERDNTAYYSSFVPDTVLSYPNNAFFALMEYKLASLLGSLLGIANPYLENTALPNAESQFYATLNKTNNQTRIRNVNR